MGKKERASPAPSIADNEKSSTVNIDMRTDLTSPHNDPSNPFAFTPNQLSALMDPKNLPLLHTFDGLVGVAKGLHANIQHGLSTNAQIHTPISLTDIIHHQPQDPADTTQQQQENTPTHTSSPPSIRSQHQNDQASSTHHDSPFASARTDIFGTNVLPPVRSKNIFQLMWMAMKDKTLILLTVAAFVSLAVGLYEDIAETHYDAQGNKVAGVQWVEGVAIIVAILIVVLVGSVNDLQKEKQFRKLNAKKEDRMVKATRDGTTSLISVHDIQVGDVLHLEPGDIVAADGIFIEGHNLKCDESAATGESDAVRKLAYDVCWRMAQAEAQEVSSSTDNEKKSEGSRPNVDSHKSLPDPFIISGSKVLEGVATYLVTSVGIHSYYGRTLMALRTESESTPLQEKLNALAEMIAKLGSAAGLLMLIVLLIRYFVGWRNGIPTEATTIVSQIMDILIVVVTIVVVAVPEGLPLAVTLALAYATQRMLKDNNLVRVLAACETMGNATTVCSDKTGTLTQNKMTVVAGTLGSSFRFVKDAPANRVDLKEMAELPQHVPKPVLNFVNQSIAINSTAFESKDEKGEMAFVGNKTETALLAFARDTGSENFQDLRNRWPVEQVLPFNSERKAMATVIRLPHPTEPSRFIYRAHVKGASEILLTHCSNIITLKPSEYKSLDHDYDIKTRALTDEDRKRTEHIIQSYATRCLRTIGIGYRDFDQWPPSKEEIDDGVKMGAEADVPFEDIVSNNGLTLLGIVGIEDPLRPGVKEAVKSCQKAGVFVRMVTGDNVVTAKSIAKQCGIYTPGGIVMEGPVFRNLPPSEMDAILPRLQVLARSSPEDKQILVGRLKELGDIVAVTGDGTNDGPALKLADVGFSMGIAGTEVAKEASSIILMDDNFSSIVKAIMWGRCVNDAVKKFLEFQLTVNVTAVILTFISAVASSNQKSVLTAVQLLWVNLIMDTLAALALATDPPTEELLYRAPEPRSAPLITFKMWKMIIGQAIFQVVVTLVLLYSDVLHYDSESVVLQTIVFNTFVFCQLFNEINCRRIDSKLNIFHNILANRFFIFIFILCVTLQCLIVNFGGAAFQVTPVGGPQWAIAIVVGLLSLPIGVVIRLIPDNIFSFLFWNPATRQRYLGGPLSGSVPPSVYMAGNERVAWNHAYTNVQQSLQSLKYPSATHAPNNIPTDAVIGHPDGRRKSALAASVMLPTLVATAPSTGWVPPDHENENQDTQFSYISR
ncbi:PMCA-type calcium-translocating P-type ATPase [Radiomyces spectabilis]|uniref:PMCA-type calcium-translocating P-type ATPase n=1 Tax=Radiomyces spectabilis TaxID=64574 RepID=UPI0022210124|nr:PMCA-type calcium-translocating P-type ATPase [Radiomyces spectabilis]KAI8376542.1 PMCA-type calcium-translocating P-type ATPase [Radiomyces spectabilis]